MLWKKGDRVRILGETGRGVVTNIATNGQVMVELEGFEFPFPPENLISLTTSQKGDEPGLIPTKDFLDNLITHQRREANDPMEVDLHLHEIIRNERGLKDGEKLEIQLDHCLAMIRKAKKERQKQLIIIHGVGEGVLRAAVRNLLHRHELEYEDASFSRYGRGATLVYIR